MSDTLQKPLIEFCIYLLVSLIIWRYYKGRLSFLTERYSTFAPRFWAGEVDYCVLLPISFVTAAIFSMDVPKVVIMIFLVLESFAWIIYVVVMHAKYGQTVGKMVTKVRVVDFHTEKSISWYQSLLRESIPAVLNLVFIGYVIWNLATGDAKANIDSLSASSTSFWVLMSLPFFWFLAEVLTMLTNEKRRALHDLIAGTVIVRINVPEGSVISEEQSTNSA